MSVVSYSLGTASSPSSSDSVVLQSTLYADSASEQYWVAVDAESHLSAGTLGIAVGVLAEGFADGTWGPGSNHDAGAIGLVAAGNSSRGGTVFGANITANVSSTTGATCNGLEIDLEATANTTTKYGLVINSTGDDTGSTTGSLTIAGGATYTDSAFILLQASGSSAGTGVGFPYGLLSVKQSVNGVAPVQSTGSLWRAGGFSVTNGLDWPDMTFTGAAIKLPNFTVSGSGQLALGGTGSVLNANGATTQNVYYELNNTGGSLRLGVEANTGGGNVLGSSAYAGTLSTYTARPLQLGTNNTVRMTIDTTGNTTLTGNIQASSDGSHTAYLPPVYTNAGAATAGTLHIVTGQTTLTWSGGTQSNAVTVALSGAAVFASAGSYEVIATPESDVGSVTEISAGARATNSFALQGRSASTASTSITVDWIAIGT